MKIPEKPVITMPELKTALKRNQTKIVVVNEDLAHMKLLYLSKVLSVWILIIFGVIACAVVKQPKYEDAKLYYNRGNDNYYKGQYNQAISNYTKAINIDPKYAKAYNNRGNTYEEMGHYDLSVSDYTKAIELDHGYAEAYNNLAWLYATCKKASVRNGLKAMENAKKAVEIEQTIATLDTLAAAYAESGEFSNAIKTEKEAIRICKDPELRKQFQDLLKAYQSNKTYAQFKYLE